MISLLKITMGHNSLKSLGGVTEVAVLYLCTSSSHVCYLYKVLRKYLIDFQSY